MQLGRRLFSYKSMKMNRKAVKNVHPMKWWNTFADQGILIEYTIGYSPSQNNAAKRFFRIPVQNARCMLPELKPDKRRCMYCMYPTSALKYIPAISSQNERSGTKVNTSFWFTAIFETA